MDGLTDYKDYFSSTPTPTKYSTVVTNIETFIENNLAHSRRIVLVTVSVKCVYGLICSLAHFILGRPQPHGGRVAITEISHTAALL